jgi:hypothetical protein
MILGIPFPFQVLPWKIWHMVIQQMEKKIEKWLTKPLAIAIKFQVCTNILVTIHIYYSLC